MATRSRFGWLILLPLLGVGCAHYDYVVTDPARLSQRVTSEAQTTLKADPLIYSMIAKEDRLVVIIKNPLAEPVQLLGDKSTVVDPKGQSHPLRSQTIAPNAYVKLILPPLRPRFETPAPAGFEFGVQSRADSAAPIYLDSFSDADSYYWDFDGPGQIRLLLTFQKPDGSTWTNEFAIRKEKV